jgi:hypothetical protein
MNPAQPSRPDLPQLRRLAALALLLFALPLQAEPATATPPPLIVGDDLRLPEVFTSHLPQTIPSDDFRLSVHPHLGDLKGRDYLRTTIGARYGLTSKWEASASTEFYFTHGLDQGSLFKQVGLSKLGLGTKYNLGPRPIPSWSTAIGFDFSTPVSRPPVELADGLRHYNPYLVCSKRLDFHPEIRLFWGVGVDIVSHLDSPGEPGKNQLADNATALSAGAVWDHHSMHYTFEAAWDSTRLLGHTQEDTLTLRPGVIWEVPWFRSRKSGRVVLLGAALHTSFGPDGTGFGTGAKLRINFDPKAHDGSKATPPPAP